MRSLYCFLLFSAASPADLSAIMATREWISKAEDVADKVSDVNIEPGKNGREMMKSRWLSL